MKNGALEVQPNNWYTNIYETICLCLLCWLEGL